MSARALAAPTWALLAIFIVYASLGTWASDGPRIWAPAFVSLTDLAQNFLLYIPFGIFGVLTLRRRPRGLATSIAEVAVITATFSLFAEVIQLYTVNRVASLTDVVMAVAGSITGGLLAEPAGLVADRAIERTRPSGLLESPDRLVLFVLLAAIAFTAWFPFDPTLDITTMTDRLRVIRRDPWMFDAVAIGAQALLYAWLSLAVALCASRLTTAVAAGAAVAAAVVVAVIADVGQLAMGAQPIGLAGFAAQIAGAMTGAALFAMARVPK